MVRRVQDAQNDDVSVLLRVDHQLIAAHNHLASLGNTAGTVELWVVRQSTNLGLDVVL